MLANRLSYFYDLRGPSIMLDTACSSSLGGLYLACQSLLSGNSDHAIVGGSNVILDPRCWSSMSAMRFLSPDGRCFSFDHRANGYARGEGTACVMLKPLDAAIRDGNTVRAVIRHIGTNQDGKTMGITLPSKDAQEDLIRRLYAEAGLKTSETSYLETHGTGTQAGDPLEAGAIASVFALDRDEPLVIGSVKTNIGHTEGLSGLAALIKTVLMLEHRMIVPNCNFEKPNASIPLRDWKLKVPTATEPWVVSGPRRASLNNFGFGGSNFHAILEDAEGYLAARGLPGKYRKVYRVPVTNGLNGTNGTNGTNKINGTNGVNGIGGTNVTNKVNGSTGSSQVNGTNGADEINGINGLNQVNGTNRVNVSNGTNGTATNDGHAVGHTPRLFTLSAFHEASGAHQVARLKSYLGERLADHARDHFLGDLSYTLAERRTHHIWRKAVIASSFEELHGALQPDSVKFSRSKKSPRLGFVFTGQGAQWHAMGRELMSQYPVYLESLQKSQRLLYALGASWSLINELSRDESSCQLGLALLAQPACTAIQVALVDLLETWGVRPSAVVGHSSGEIAGAYCCGAITHEGAMLISYHRGVLAASIKPNYPHLNGAMIAAGLTPQEAEERIALLTRGKATVACVNSPQSVTVAGDAQAVDELQAALQLDGVFNRKLRVDVAYHSHHMQVVAEEYLAALSGLEVNPAAANKCSFYSSVRGKRLDGSELGSRYWVDNMVSTVQFASALKALCTDARGKRQHRSSTTALNVGTLVEIGPHAALAGPVKEIMKLDETLSSAGIAYNSALYRKREATTTAMELACSLFESGYEVNFAAVNRPSTIATPDLVVDLPPFAWDHSKRYWAESRTSKQLRLKAEPRADLLGTLSVESTTLEPRWRNMIRHEEIPWVRDHVVQSNIVYPGAGYMCMAIEAANRRAAANGASVTGFRLRNIVISQALVIPEETADIEIQISLRPLNDSVKALSKTWDEFCVQSLTSSGMWVENCRGLISVVKAATREDESLLTNDAEEQVFYAKELASLRELCQSNVDTSVIYGSLAELGLEYGPTFANMKTARASPEVSVATVAIADTAASQPSGFQYPHILHPTTLDALFHTVFPCDADQDGKVPHAIILTGIDELYVSSSLSAEPGHEFTACTRTSRVDNATRQGTALVFDGAEEIRGPVVVIKGIKYTPHDKETHDENAQQDTPLHLTHKVVWHPDVNFPVSDPDAVYSPLTVPSEEVDRSLDLQRAAYYYSEDALQLVAASEVVEEHHKALWNWMVRTTAMVKEDKFDYPTAQWTAATRTKRDEFLLANSTTSDEARLLAAIGTNLADILRGTVPPLSVMMEDGLLGKFYENNITGNGPLEVCPPYIGHLAHKNPHMRILEIGAGTGGMTSPVLDVLGGAGGTTPRFTEYVYTDISSGFFEGAKEKFKDWAHLIQYRKLDIEVEPSQQGYETGHFDVVIAHNVLHATTQIKRTLQHVRSLLKPGGRLLLSEITGEKLSIGLVWGTLPGWWAGIPEGRVNGPLLTEDGWQEFLQDSGFSGIDLARWRSIPYDSLRQGTFMVARAEEPELQVPNEITLVAEGALDSVKVDTMKTELESMGITVRSSTLAGIQQASGQFFVVLDELAGPILKDPSEEQFTALKALLCDCDGVLWVSEKGASVSPSNPDRSLFGGLANSLRTEVGGSAHISLDLDECSGRSPEETTAVIMRVLRESFRAKQSGGGEEVSYAERAGVIYTPRVVDEHEFREAFALETQPPVPTEQPYHQEGRALVPRLRVPGLLDTVYFQDDENVQDTLPDNFVRIQVKASGLNFHDIMTSMGQIKSSHMGFEAAGVVTATGKNVHDLHIGDRVVALGHDLLTNVAHVPRTHVHKFPDALSFETAASLPVVYTTAYYSLFNLARVQPGDRVLVHAAAGGLGHAAIDVCRYAGAEVFATVSTKEKKELLMSSFGIPADHIFSSRRSGFGEGILRVSGGAGVDIVLNSLSGDFVRESLSCMAPLGRFIELGRHDFLVNSRLEMAPLRNNITFVVADLLMIVDERPAMIMPALQEMLRLVGSGELRVSLPHSTFSMSELESALRTMQTGRHTGKLVAVPRPDDVVKALPAREKGGFLRPDATYVLVGGSGGLGQAQALWMASVGAKNLILASRKGDSCQEAKDLLSELQSQGVKAAALRCDVSNADDVEGLVAYAQENMPPIRGLVHGGMVLRVSTPARDPMKVTPVLVRCVGTHIVVRTRCSAE